MSKILGYDVFYTPQGFNVFVLGTMGSLEMRTGSAAFDIFKNVQSFLGQKGPIVEMRQQHKIQKEEVRFKEEEGTVVVTGRDEEGQVVGKKEVKEEEVGGQIKKFIAAAQVLYSRQVKQAEPEKKELQGGGAQTGGARKAQTRDQQRAKEKTRKETDKLKNSEQRRRGGVDPLESAMKSEKELRKKELRHRDAEKHTKTQEELRKDVDTRF